MDSELEAWLAECIGKGTFANREDALEFCVGATRAYCIMNKIHSGLWRDNDEAAEQLGDDPIPIKWVIWKPALNAAARDFGNPLGNTLLI